MILQRILLACVPFAAGVLLSLPAQAIPKAAEHEDAAVALAPDVARPKASTKPLKKDVQKKSSAVAKPKPKPYKPAPAPKKAKPAPAKR